MAKIIEQDEVEMSRKAFDYIRAAAERQDTPELSLNEINEEIKKVRSLTSNN